MDDLHDKDLHYMRLAIDEARLASARGEVPIAAILVGNDKILAQAHNFRELWQDPTAHAEMIAIREAATRLGTWRLTDMTLYVTLEPCTMCAGAIVLARIPRLVFAAPDPKAGACGSLFNITQDERLNHRVEVASRVLEPESQELLQSFFRSLRERNDQRISLKSEV
ncbi:tRNA-specific adenosine deaminase [Nitrospira tepida]|uniref:tRNA-specific adenosine deaminase n=1 Tax=Nitrospira tepida TaxID=2973512 RepID=A0AA86T7L1_9BACT|nr:tRNA adenosine(34) deaminase TadA [Nitrospira tepida]CAI4031803.1 tRNA-specific adenosine deaminase [Nitrospira tepida]